MAAYPVRCECGKTHHVPGSAAGTTIVCDCRRTIEVPSFAQLKASVGESSVSIDLVLRHMLANGELPVETDCLVCTRTTRHRATFTVECEREEMISAKRHPWLEFFALMIFRPLSLFVSAYGDDDDRIVGRNVALKLPIRVCKECEMDLKTEADVRALMMRTEVYGRLFEKFPEARVH